MQLVQRVIAAFHYPLAECTCCTANADSCFMLEMRRKFLQGFLNKSFCTAIALLYGRGSVEEELFEPDRSQIERVGVDNFSSLNQCQIGRSAANINGDGIREWKQIVRRYGTKVCLLPPIDNPDIQPKLFF